MIDKDDKLPVTRQCGLLDLSRSAVYYTPVPLSEKDRELMRQIDEIHSIYFRNPSTNAKVSVNP